MTIISKALLSLSLVTLLVGANGCMSYSAIRDARGEQEKAQWLGEGKSSDNKSHPAHYAWLPLTVPADIATLPFQGFYFGFGYYMLRTDGVRQPWSQTKKQ